MADEKKRVRVVTKKREIAILQPIKTEGHAKIVSIPILHDETPIIYKERTKLEEEKMVEVALMKPLFFKYSKVAYKIKRDIESPSITDATKYISPVTIILKTFKEVESIRASRETVRFAGRVAESLETIRRRMIRPRFKQPTEIDLPKVNIAVKTAVKDVTEIIKFTHLIEVFFMQARDVRPKAVARETPASMLRATPEEVARMDIEEVEGPLERYFQLYPFRITSERPILIFAEKPSQDRYSYIELLKRVLREIYRVSVGGLPRPRDVRTTFEEMRFDMRGGESVFILDIDESSIKETEKYVKDRLRELYSQGFGFIVIYGTEAKIREIGALLGGEELKIPHPINISVEENNTLFHLTSSMYGFLWADKRSLDTFTVRVEGEFYEKIYKIALDPRTAVFVEPSKDERDGLDGESLVHYGIKGFVVRHLINNEKVKPEAIMTERELVDIVVDVYAEHPKLGSLAVEVETLYGTTIPALKIRKTVESRLAKELKVWVVIPNPQFVIYLNTIATLRSLYLKRHPGMVEFYTLDLGRRRLVSFEEFKERLGG